MTLYLNVLFCFFILFDSTLLIKKINQYNNQPLLISNPEFIRCSTCQKPDIYLIIADEYAGSESLQDAFGFDNSVFEKNLESRGFYIVKKSSSNYNSTPFSVASLLNMSYLSNVYGSHNSRKDLTICYQAISKSRILQFFEMQGYEFINNSIFDFPGKHATINQTFLPKNIDLITMHTLAGRIKRDLGYHLITSFGNKKLLNKINSQELENNNKLLSLTLNLTNQKSYRPKFVYTHLLMPHYPYYFNKDGLPYDRKTVQDHHKDMNQYIEYLQYCNKKFLALIDSIINTSAKSPIILLMSDHGFRQWDTIPHKGSSYNTLNSVLLPGRNYSQFYEGMTNVNQFRVILNTEFSQNLSLLQDSMILISNKIAN